MRDTWFSLLPFLSRPLSVRKIRTSMRKGREGCLIMSAAVKTHLPGGDRPTPRPLRTCWSTKNTSQVEPDMPINAHAGICGDIDMCLLTWGQGLLTRTLSCGKLRCLDDPASARFPGVCTLSESRSKEITIAVGSSLCPTFSVAFCGCRFLRSCFWLKTVPASYIWDDLKA